VSAVLVYSMTVSADGFVTDRDGGIGWGGSSADLLAAQHEHAGGLGAYLLGRRLHETMLPWEIDEQLRSADPAFADAWVAMPEVVFSRTLDAVAGSARLATRPLAEEVALALASTDGDVSIGGAHLAAQAIDLDLVDEYRLIRSPVILGGGTPFLPPVARTLALRLVETRGFEGGAVLERYHRLR
jgi:dihydrofolate reductase